MYQQDYILRQIEMLGTLLRRMLQSIREGRDDEPLVLVDEVFEDVSGTSPELIEALPVEGLLAMLSAGGQLDEGRTALLGMLLLQRAVAFDAAGRPRAAQDMRTKAGALLGSLPAETDPKLLGSVAQLRAELEDAR